MEAFRLSSLPTAYDLSARIHKRWRAGVTFTPHDYVFVDDHPWVCLARHISTGDDRPGEPGSGSLWARALQEDALYIVGSAIYSTDDASPPTATQLGGSGGGSTPIPLPFFGDQTQSDWVRPAATGFPIWLNEAPTGSDLVQTHAAAVVDNPGGLPLVLVVRQDCDDYYITARLKSIGAGPWTVTTAQAAAGAIHNGIFITYPFVLYNTGSDKALVLSWTLGGGADGGRVTLGRVTDASLPGLGISEDDFGFGFPSNDYFEWFRVESDGTNLTFSISPEGKLWFPTYVEPLANFIGSVDQIGFGVERLDQNGTGVNHGNDAACIVWSWVEI